LIKIRTAVYLGVIVIFALLGCEQVNKVNNMSVEPYCLSSQNTCTVKSSHGEFLVLFTQEQIVTENPFDIIFIAQDKRVIKKISAHMEGKNMYMGKIPLFFSSSTGEFNLTNFSQNHNSISYSAKTMLGSCTEEIMRWIIFFDITLEDIKGNTIIESFTIEFNGVIKN
jgi:hypothetical protein